MSICGRYSTYKSTSVRFGRPIEYGKAKRGVAGLPPRRARGLLLDGLDPLFLERREHSPTDLGVEPEPLGVALVQLRARLVRFLFGQVPAPEVGVQPGEVRLPPGGVLGAQRAVVEDVSEGQQAAVALRPKLEPKALSAPGPGEQARRVDLGHLAGFAVGLEGFAGLGSPLDRREEPLGQLLGL